MSTAAAFDPAALYRGKAFYQFPCAMGRSTLPATLKVLLAVLSHEQRAFGPVTLTDEELARRIGCRSRQVTNLLAGLEALGLIERARSRRIARRGRGRLITVIGCPSFARSEPRSRRELGQSIAPIGHGNWGNGLPEMDCPNSAPLHDGTWEGTAAAGSMATFDMRAGSPDDAAAAAAPPVSIPPPEPEAPPPAAPIAPDKTVYVRLLELRVDEGEALRIAETRDVAWVEGWKAEYEQPKAGFKGALAAVLVGMHQRNKNPPKPPPKPAPPIRDGERRRREIEAEEARLAALLPEERERLRQEADEAIQRCMKLRFEGSSPRATPGSPEAPDGLAEQWLLDLGIPCDLALAIHRKRARDWIEPRLARLKAGELTPRALGRALLQRMLEEDAAETREESP